MAEADLQQEVNVIDELLRKGFLATKLENTAMEKVVIFLGFTGSGKSTATKFILKDPSLKIEEDFQGFFNFVDGDKCIGSSDSHTSKTLYPNVRTDEETGSTFVDCAGFEDSRSPEKDLVASFLNKLVLDSAKQLKIVIVENCSKLVLTEDRTAFIKVLNHVATILQNNHHSFKDSIALIATKNNDGRSDQKVIKSIETYLEKTLIYLEGSAPQCAIERDLVQFLMDNQKIGQIKKPLDIFEPWNTDPCLSDECEYIRDMIFNKMTFAEQFDGKFNISLAPQSKLFLERNNNLEAESKIFALIDNEIIPSLIQKFEIGTKNLGNTFLVFCEEYVATVAAFQTTGSLRDFLVEQKLSIELIDEFEFSLKKSEFLFTVTDNSKLYAQVMAKILNLNGGCIKLTNHVKDVAKKFISDMMKKLEDHLVEVSASLKNLLSQSIESTKELEVADFLDEYHRKFSSALTHHEAMLQFVEEQGVKKSLIESIRNILMHFQSNDCTKEKQEITINICQLNYKKGDIFLAIHFHKQKIISSLNSKVTKKIDKVLDLIILNLREEIESSKDLDKNIQFSEDILKTLSSDVGYKNFEIFVKKYDSGDIKGGNILKETKLQLDILAKRGEEKETLKFLDNKFNICRENIKASKCFLKLLRNIRIESMNYVVIRSQIQILQLAQNLNLQNFKKDIISLSKYGFSTKIVSDANELKFTAESIDKLSSFLTSTFASENVLITYPGPSSVHAHYQKCFALSKVMNEGPHESVHVVAFMASKKLIVDVNWNFTNTHVILMAPVIEFRKGAKFHLHGQNGATHLDKKAADAASKTETGRDGQDGNAGFISGTLSLFALNVIGAQNLQVMSCGGDGNDGQDGGKGWDGKLVEETKEVPREVSIVVDAKWAAIPLVGSVFAAIEAIKGGTRIVSESVKVFSEEPTYGGFGGKAGAGAPAGTVHFSIKQEENAKWSIKRKKGKNGRPGRTGMPGKHIFTNDQNLRESTSIIKNIYSNFLSICSENDLERNNIPLQYKYDSRLILEYLRNEYISLASKINDGNDTKEFVDYVSGISLDRVKDLLFEQNL